MNTKQVIAASVLALLGTAAMADSETLAPEFSAPSTLTRAQVQAELAKAKAEGSYLEAAQNDAYPVDVKQALTQRSRDEVRAEARAAARTHWIDSQYLPG